MLIVVCWSVVCRVVFVVVALFSVVVYGLVVCVVRLVLNQCVLVVGCLFDVWNMVIGAGCSWFVRCLRAVGWCVLFGVLFFVVCCVFCVLFVVCCCWLSSALPVVCCMVYDACCWVVLSLFVVCCLLCVV